MRSLKTLLLNTGLRCTHTLFISATVLLGMSGCDSTSEIGQETDPGVVKFAIPESIRTVSAVDLNAVQAIATVNNEETSLTRNGNQFQTTISVEVNSQVTVSLLFRETLPDGTVIDLAMHPAVTRIITTSDQRLEFFESGYQTDFDFDGDGISNIAERELNTDPLTPSNLPLTRTIDVSFNLPGIILEPQITQAITTFSGAPRAVRRDGNFFQITGTASTGNNVIIKVILRQLQQFDGINQTIVIADASRSVPIGIDNMDIQLEDSDFNFDIDSDGDGRNNLQELRQGTNPLISD